MMTRCLSWMALFCSLWMPAALRAADQPILIYLFGRYSDYVNIGITQDRIQRTIHAVEQLRKERPDSGISAVLLFSGALSEKLASDPDQSGMKALIGDAVRRGIIEVGYDGSDEPTYVLRPVAALSGATTPAKRWHAHTAAAKKFLGEARDPVDGRPRAGVLGGLRKMQEVFGPAACVMGLTPLLGSDSEYIHELTRHNSAAILFGLPDPDPALQIHGYRGSVEFFGKQMSPVPYASSELYWQDGVLRSSDTSTADLRRISAHEGVQTARALIEKLDRSRVRVIHMELADQRLYLKEDFRNGGLYPPIRMAFEHPDQPSLPGYALLGRDKVEDAYAAEDAVLKWLATEYLPKNAGCRFVSSADLKRMAAANASQSVRVPSLVKSTAEMLKQWDSNTYPPNFLTVDTQYLSLAEMFEAMASALGESQRTGRLPGTVRIGKVYGPLEMPDTPDSINTEISRAAVAAACARLSPQLTDDGWQPVPRNAVPGWVDVDGKRVNAAQFLRLAAEALVNPKEPTLKVRYILMFSPAGTTHPINRPQAELGATWTFKPAVLNLAP